MVVLEDATKICYHCGKPKPLADYAKDSRAWDGRRNKCKDCVREHQRSPEYLERTRIYDQARAQSAERKAKYIEWQRDRRARLPERKKARDLVAKHLTREPCIICGNPKAEGHHEDYDKPLEVVWLCRAHHKDYHKGLFSLWEVTTYQHNNIK